MKRWLSALLGLVATAGCFFSFDNPIEVQPNNSVSGTVAAADPICGDPQNALVTVLWTSGYDTHPGTGGRFLLLGLPDGVYSLRFDYFDPDAGADAGALCSGLLPNVELPKVFNQSDALDVGTFQLAPLVTLTGFVDAGGGPVVVGSFSPDSPAGPGLYESFFAAADGTGHFGIKVPPGRHVIWVSSGSLSVPLDLTLDGGDQDLGEVVLVSPDAGTSLGAITGNVVVSLPGFGAQADAGAVSDLFGIGGTNFELNPPQPLPVTLTTQVPGVGVEMTQPVIPGQLSDFFCGLKDESHLPPGVVFDDLKLPHLPAFAGRPTTLGQITWLSNDEFIDAGLAPPADYEVEGDGGVDAGIDAGQDGGSDAGAATGPDAGPPGWRLIGSIPLDAGLQPPYSVEPVQFDGGAAVFFDVHEEAIYVAFGTDGGYGPPIKIDTNDYWVASAGVDARGLPLAVVNNGTDSNGYCSLLEPLPDTSWAALPILSDAGFPVTNRMDDCGALVAAPPGANAWTVPATAYYVFQDVQNAFALDLAAFVPPSTLSVVGVYSAPGAAGSDGMSDISAVSCVIDGDPALCIAYDSQAVFLLSIDLTTGTGSSGSQLQPDTNNSYDLAAHALPDGGVLVGWIEQGSNTEFPSWSPEVPPSAFACSSNGNFFCVPPLVFTGSTDVSGGNAEWLDFHGDPLLLYATASGEDGLDLANASSLDISETGFFDLYGGNGAYTDSTGAPVVAEVLDAGTSVIVQVYRYF